jgi:hypothetical protein
MVLLFLCNDGKHHNKIDTCKNGEKHRRQVWESDACLLTHPPIGAQSPLQYSQVSLYSGNAQWVISEMWGLIMDYVGLYSYRLICVFLDEWEIQRGTYLSKNGEVIMDHFMDDKLKWNEIVGIIKQIIFYSISRLFFVEQFEIHNEHGKD